jgi:hypothetical protein
MALGMLRQGSEDEMDETFCDARDRVLDAESLAVRSRWRGCQVVWRRESQGLKPDSLWAVIAGTEVPAYLRSKGTSRSKSRSRSRFPEGNDRKKSRDNDKGRSKGNDKGRSRDNDKGRSKGNDKRRCNGNDKGQKQKRRKA